MRLRLTKREVDRAEYSGDGRSPCLWWDTSTPGLVLRVYPPRGTPPASTKVFLLVYREPGGRRRWHKIARYGEITVDQAQEHARTLLARLRLAGESPASKPAASPEMTVEGLVCGYLEARRPRPEIGRPGMKTWAEAARVLRKDFVSALGRLALTDLTRSDIRRLVWSVAQRGAPVAANRLLAQVKACLSWAVQEDLLIASPADLVSRPSQERPRTRVLSAEEIRLLWWGLEGCSSRNGKRLTFDSGRLAIRQALRLTLVTGQRPGEVCGIHPRELSPDGAWWILPPERVKTARFSGHPHRVPLSALAREVLRAGLPHLTVWYLDRATRERLIPALGLAAFTPHDLRRTANTGMNSIGVDPFVVERVLNHSLGRIQRTYNLYGYDAEKRAALDAWGREIERIIE